MAENKPESVKFDPRGYTEASVSYMNESALTARLMAVQKKHGIQTGERFSDKGQHVVSVTFYPKPVFYIQDRNADGSLGEARVMQQEEYASTWGLRL